MTLNFDMVITGGGPAGVACAYTAAKLGLKVLLVEKNSYLGGQMTGALVVPMMKSMSENINTDFYKDLLEHAKKFGAQITYEDGNDGWLNPVLLKIILSEMFENVGVNILYEAQVTDAETILDEKTGLKTINSVKIDTETLSIHIFSKYFVDATGNSNFCKILNCNFIDDFGKFQPDSLRFIISGIDLEQFAQQITEIDSDRNVTTACKIDGNTHLSTAYTFDTNKNWALRPIFEQAIKEGVLEFNDTAYFQVFTIAGMPNSLAFNCPRLENSDRNDIFDKSRAINQAYKRIYRLYNFVKKYFKGFTKSYIAQIADMTGVRVSKRPVTKYIYKLNDMTSGKTFEKPVLTADYPIDIHSNEQNNSTLETTKKYFLPVESLISADYNNLFVAGRNLGAEFETQAALRIQKSCLSMGEAVAKHIFKLN